MSLITVDGAPIDRSDAGRLLARPIVHRERPSSLLETLIFASISLLIGGFLAFGAVVSLPISALLTASEALLAALFLYLSWGFWRDAARDRRRARRDLTVTYGLEDVLVEAHGERRRLPLDDAFEDAFEDAFARELKPTAELRHIVAVRQAFRGAPADSPLRKAMEWAVWIYIEDHDKTLEPIYVALPPEAKPYGFFASDLREDGDDIDALLARGVPVVRLALRRTHDGLQPVLQRRAAALITRPLFGSSRAS